jgi:hypothetical protein
MVACPIGTLGSVASMLAAKFYQRNPDRNHKLWNIVSTERYILHMQVLLECLFERFTLMGDFEYGNILTPELIDFCKWCG